MNKIIIILINILIIQYCFSQNVNSDTRYEFKGKKTVATIKGNECVFRIDSLEEMCIVRKASSLEKVIPNSGQNKFTVNLYSQEKLNQIVRESLHSYIQNHPIDSKDLIYIYFMSDSSGKIVDVYFLYEWKLNLPIDKLEKIEQKIIKNCQLIFDKELLNPDESNYVKYICSVFLKETCY